MKNKTYSKGESLAELLVASLIISLAMIMLFSGVKVGSDIMTNSRNKYIEYIDEANRYESEQAEYAKLFYVPPPAEPEAFTFTMVPDRDNIN